MDTRRRTFASIGARRKEILPAVLAALLSVSVTALLFPAAAEAAQFNARVSGQVTDAEGQPLAGVKVTISLVNNRRIDPIPPTELTTDEEGRYFGRNVRVGDSHLVFELEGYETLTERRELRVGAQNIDVTMKYDVAAAKVEAANLANAQYQEGVAKITEGDYAGAIESLQQALAAIEDTPENAEARGSVHALIGRAYFEQQDWEQAIASYREWVRHQPDDANAHLELASALTQAGQQEEAMQHFERALELNPQDPTSLYNIGIQMVNSGAVESGIPLIERAIEAQPEFPLALKNLGYAYARVERYQEAVDAFEKYLEQSPEAEDAAEIRDFVAALKEMIG